MRAPSLDAAIRDAGFTLRPDAEAWDELSVEQAYDRLPEPDDGDSREDDAPSNAAGAGASADAQSSPDGDDDDSNESPDSAGDEEAQDGDGGDPNAGDGGGQRQEDDGPSDAPPSHDPSGTGEVMDAGTRAGDDGDAAETPVDVVAEEQAWDEAMHQALNLARAEGELPGRVEETVRAPMRAGSTGEPCCAAT